MESTSYNRSYNQFCPLAYALDVIGERWTLLIVRELLAGPRRYKDIVDGLPGISTNLLTERLRNLEEQGIISHRTLPPPAGSAVYELTPRGQALESAVLELGKWGADLLPASLEGDALPSVGSCALGIQAFFRPEEARAHGINETYELHIGNEILQVRIIEGEIQVQRGESLKPDAIIHTDMPSYLGLFSGQLKPDQAFDLGLVRVEGDPEALGRFLALCGLPVFSSPGT